MKNVWTNICSIQVEKKWILKLGLMQNPSLYNGIENVYWWFFSQFFSRKRIINPTKDRIQWYDEMLFMSNLPFWSKGLSQLFIHFPCVDLIGPGWWWRMELACQLFIHFPCVGLIGPGWWWRMGLAWTGATFRIRSHKQVEGIVNIWSIKDKIQWCDEMLFMILLHKQVEHQQWSINPTLDKFV